MLARNKFRKAAIFGLTTLLVAPAVSASELPGDGKTIKVAKPTWNTGWFQTQIYLEGLKELGYKINGPSTLDVPVFFQSVAQNDVQVWFDSAFPLHNNHLNEVDDRVKPVGYITEGGGGSLEGYMVDKKTAERLDVTNLDDFRREKVKDAFDIDDDGKAEMVACPPGWGCEEAIAYHMKAYNLNSHIDLIKAKYSASMADAFGRYKNDGSIFFYTWTPNWTVGTLKPGKDVVWIEVPHPDLPEGQKHHEDDVTISNVEGCVNDPCMLGFPANDLRPVANKRFLKNNPAAARFIEQVRIPLSDIYDQNAKMFDGEDADADIRRHAQSWIKENRAAFDRWLANARKASKSP